MIMSGLPIVVIGAGPLGLAAAAHLLERGESPLVVEAGAGPASAVAEWSHVRLFSAWPELVDPAAARLLGRTGWTRAGVGLPDGWGLDRAVSGAARGRPRATGCATTLASWGYPVGAGTGW